MPTPPRDVLIRPVLNGFVVQVGCQTVVFNDLAQLASELVAYYQDPQGVERRFTEKAVNKVGEGPINVGALARNPVEALPPPANVPGGQEQRTYADTRR